MFLDSIHFHTIILCFTVFCHFSMHTVSHLSGLFVSVVKVHGRPPFLMFVPVCFSDEEKLASSEKYVVVERGDPALNSLATADSPNTGSDLSPLNPTHAHMPQALLGTITE
ncbi:hypothetical protein CHARACLAT_028287 [Characodon lateralis]|uniref:Uncharacterized protein n=1 Tax=Characodon lateralis TaxID=208331 RepID=A0ABU7EMY7_9TELE|nr:hypothetical protein [Characodon lateralis]